MPHALQNFSACGAGEVVSRAFNFANGLAAGETLTGSPTLIVSVAADDSDPQSRIVEGPVIIGTMVTFLFGNDPVAGLYYVITATVQTTANQTLEVWAYQPVLPS